MNNTIVLAGFILSVILFFWGIYKTTKTQKKIYLLYIVPFLALIIGMFFI